MTESFHDPLLAEHTGERPSGFQAAMRYRLVEWREGVAVLTLPIGPQHLNRAGVVHGGMLASLIDTACGFAGSFAATPDAAHTVWTVTLTTSFVAPARVGPLRVEGKVKGGGRTIYFAAGEVLDGEGRLVAFGEGSFRRPHAAGSPSDR